MFHSIVEGLKDSSCKNRQYWSGVQPPSACHNSTGCHCAQMSPISRAKLINQEYFQHRSSNFVSQLAGGGNCGNGLSAASRLGLAPYLVTKLGEDYIGDLIIQELQNDGVDTTHIIRDPLQSSSSSYIIVDKEGKLYKVSWELKDCLLL